MIFNVPCLYIKDPEKNITPSKFFGVRQVLIDSGLYKLDGEPGHNFLDDNYYQKLIDVKTNNSIIMCFDDFGPITIDIKCSKHNQEDLYEFCKKQGWIVEKSDELGTSWNIDAIENKHQ